WSVGIMGRTPDYLNITFAGFAGRDDEWGANGNEAGAARLVAYQKHLSRRDLALTHTLIHPTVDPASGAAPAAGNAAAGAQGGGARGEPGVRRGVRRRSRGGPGGAGAPGRRRVRAVLRDPDGHARAQVSVPRQHERAELGGPPALEPVRRAGRLRHLRRRGSA